MAAMGVVAAAHRKEGRRRWGGVGSGGARRGWGWLAPLAALLLAGGAAALVKEDCLLLNYYPPNSRLGKLDIPDVSSQVTGAFTVEFWYNLFQTRDAVTSEVEGVLHRLEASLMGDGMLAMTSAQAEEWETRGFFVLPSFLSAAEQSRLLAAVDDMKAAVSSEQLAETWGDHIG